jgi:hypothetical protein
VHVNTQASLAEVATMVGLRVRGGIFSSLQEGGGYRAWHLAGFARVKVSAVRAIGRA